MRDGIAAAGLAHKREGRPCIGKMASRMGERCVRTKPVGQTLHTQYPGLKPTVFSTESALCLSLAGGGRGQGVLWWHPVFGRIVSCMNARKRFSRRSDCGLFPCQQACQIRLSGILHVRNPSGIASWAGGLLSVPVSLKGSSALPAGRSCGACRMYASMSVNLRV